MATKRKARPKKAATRKAATRTAAGRKSATRKPPARKRTTRKPTARKAATRKSAAPKSTRGKSTLRQSLARSLPREGVGAAVKKKARQGLELAREGFERLKDATVSVTATVVEEVKERISNDDGRAPEPDARENGGVEPER